MSSRPGPLIRMAHQVGRGRRSQVKRKMRWGVASFGRIRVVRSSEVECERARRRCRIANGALRVSA
jgi:hypothetical protein